MLPSTSRQHVSSPTTINNNNNNSSSNSENNNSSSNNNHSENNNINSSNNYINNSFSNDEMDTQDLTTTPERRTREPSIYDYVPKSKKMQQYIYWKMLKDEKSLQSCLKMFKKFNLEEDTKFKHVSTSKDSSGIRLKRKIAQKKRDLFFGATSTGRIPHHPADHQQSTSSDTFCPLRNEDLQNLLPLTTFTLPNVSEEPIYSVDGFENNNSE